MFIFILAFEPETPEIELPEWIIDLADDLDVLIAQRHFEDANSLISKAKYYLEEHDQISIIVEQEIKYLLIYFINCPKLYFKYLVNIFHKKKKQCFDNIFEYLLLCLLF